MFAMFSWKGLLLAPIMVAGPLIEFFHRSFASIVDLIGNNDKYTIIVGRFHRQPAGTITAFTVPQPYGIPSEITAGPDGNLWFTAGSATGSTIDRITLDGAITVFSPVTTDSNLDIGDITAGPDGTIWFILSPLGSGPPGPGGRIGRMTTQGVVTLFPATSGSNPTALATGPDGNVWFTDKGGYIGRITPTGALTQFPVPGTVGVSGGTAAGPDGNMWFAALGAVGYVGSITHDGKVTLFPVPTDAYDDACPDVIACGIVAGLDGNLWLADDVDGTVVRITTSGRMTKFPITGAAWAIAAGPDGNVWFTSTFGGVGWITPDGAITYPALNTQSYSIEGIATGPDGNLWLAGTDTTGKGVILRATP
jgi:streptogramin lyase